MDRDQVHHLLTEILSRTLFQNMLQYRLKIYHNYHRLTPSTRKILLPLVRFDY